MAGEYWSVYRMEETTAYMTLHIPEPDFSREVSVDCSGGRVASADRVASSPELRFVVSGLEPGETYDIWAVWNDGTPDTEDSFTTLEIPKTSCDDWVIDYNDLEGTVTNYRKGSDGGWYATIRFSVPVWNYSAQVSNGRIHRLIATDENGLSSGLKEYGSSYNVGATDIGDYNIASFSLDWYWPRGLESLYFEFNFGFAAYITGTSGNMDTSCTGGILRDCTVYNESAKGEEFLWGGEVKTIMPGDEFSIRVTAQKWNDLCSYITDVTGVGIPKTGISSGSAFTAKHYNDAMTALGYTSNKSKGEAITADDFNLLRSRYYLKAGLD